MKIFTFMKKSKSVIIESSAGGHIDVAYGIHDRPGPDTPSVDLPDFEPIVPKEQVATQLSADRPPVDDPDFVPSGTREFELAMSTLASYVPDQEIEKLYNLFRKKVDKLVDDELIKSKYSGGEIMETAEKKIRKMLEENFRDEDLRQMQADFDEEFGAAGEDPPEKAPSGEASLEKIAKATGFTGPSGVKNFLYRLLSRLSRIVKVPEDEINALIDFAAGEYVDALQRADVIDEEDADFMMKNKKHVYNLPSFEFFIGTAIAGPAAKALEKRGKKKVEPYLDKLGISRPTRNTLMNQLLGQVPRNDDLINKKIDADVARGDMSAEEAEAAKDKIKSGFGAMQKLAMVGDDFVEVALEKYSKLSKSKLNDILKRAAEDDYVLELM